jgi:two-component system nitrate/nitrite response regulator NarL
MRVLIVGEVRLYCEGVAQNLERRPGIVVMWPTALFSEAVARAACSKPDIVLVDVSQPGAEATIRTLLRAVPKCRIVALAVDESDDRAVACAEAGVSAFVTRHSSLDGLASMLESALAGEVLCSPRLTGALCRRLASLAAARGGLECINLTTREQQIVLFIEEGMSNKEIARALGIQVATVKNHVHNLLDKLQVCRRGQAAARLRQRPPAPESLARS